MTTQAERPTAEIAEQIARHHLDSERVSVTQFCDIVDAIEKALRDRDERAAKIAEAMRPSGGRMWSDEQAACFEALSACAAAIRGASTDASASGDTFHCENCEQDFNERPHATDDGYWLCHPCWKGLQSEHGICECRCPGYHEVRAASCEHCS